jgi:probable HAF family extracellular repeat protein
VGLFLANMNDGSFKIVSPTVFSFDSYTHLNNLGQIAGELFVGSMIHVFVTDPNGGALHDISAPRDFSVYARDINNSGDVVGTFDLQSGPKHAFVSYDGARRIDLGSLARGNSGALGINDAGTIVGYSGTEGFIYTPESGLQNLNSFIDPSLGIDIVAGLDINNAGEILAKTSDGREVILFPRNINGVPDAGSTGILFSCALASLLLLRHWSRVKLINQTNEQQ